jgi:hypothetical protein
MSPYAPAPPHPPLHGRASSVRDRCPFRYMAYRARSACPTNIRSSSRHRRTGAPRPSQQSGTAIDEKLGLSNETERIAHARTVAVRSHDQVGSEPLAVGKCKFARGGRSRRGRASDDFDSPPLEPPAAQYVDQQTYRMPGVGARETAAAMGRRPVDEPTISSPADVGYI